MVLLALPTVGPGVTAAAVPVEKVENDAPAHEKTPGGPHASLEEAAGPVTAARVMNTTGEDRKAGDDRKEDRESISA